MPQGVGVQVPFSAPLFWLLEIVTSDAYNRPQITDAGWSSLVARRAHNPKVVGSNPAPATKLLLIAISLKLSAVSNATLAQLVERNLAKVEVTSSNLVCRSTFLLGGK